MPNSDTEIKKVTLPRFKDKVMYVSSDKSDTKLETSYVISSSFKGIVRLSPNNHNTTYEKPTYQLSLSDEKNLGTTYSDAIKFDSEVENAIKSDADITKRMIIGSDSDGYAIGFRISQDNFEFDKLGVIGVLEANHLSIISSAQTPNEDVLLLNAQRMPHIHNTVSDAQNIKTYVYKQPPSEEEDDEIQPHQYHTKDVKITGDGDKTFLLFSQSTSDGKKYYKYQRAHYLIRELILEALMDFQTIPTGSIHWFPVTLEQFKSLCIYNGNRPNVSHLVGGEAVDPLLRDFLLCDGRCYNNKDFPELAKILWKEPIRRWRPIDNSENYLYPFMDDKCNEYGAKEPKIDKTTGEEMKDADGNTIRYVDFTFRVPDLRHQFISSTHIDGTTRVASGSASDGIGAKSVVGAWCIDNTPPSSTHFRDDRHAHFIAYGSYGKTFHTNENVITTGVSLVTSEEDIENDKKLWLDNSVNCSIVYNKNLNDAHFHNGTFTTFLLHNHPYSFGNNTWFRGFGWRYNTPTDRIHAGVDSIPATMWLSRPKITSKEYNEWKMDRITIGMSSPDVASVEEPKDYKDIDEEFQGNVKWNETYEPWANYQTDLYGHESSPKYYAMLPFIKI